ncbi:hypothetical protein WJX84_007171 [Apatococcus fuscideae]|uniref:Uncharacterized protein n=1 Tax=Apatococcus fuscideae TaxID=2026836 RepID=A0AAW1THR3_9CHLO
MRAARRTALHRTTCDLAETLESGPFEALFAAQLQTAGYFVAWTSLDDMSHLANIQEKILMQVLVHALQAAAQAVLAARTALAPVSR